MTDNSAGTYDNAGSSDNADFDYGGGISDGADSAGFDGGVDDGAEFGDAFFTSLEAGPGEDPADPEALALDEPLDLEGDDGTEAFQYEAEGDGSFETDAAEFDPAAFDADDFPFELGGEG
jgi:hypothetical protein